MADTPNTNGQTNPPADDSADYAAAFNAAMGIETPKDEGADAGGQPAASDSRAGQPADNGAGKTEEVRKTREDRVIADSTLRAHGYSADEIKGMSDAAALRTAQRLRRLQSEADKAKGAQQRQRAGTAGNPSGADRSGRQQAGSAAPERGTSPKRGGLAPASDDLDSVLAMLDDDEDESAGTEGTGEADDAGDAADETAAPDALDDSDEAEDAAATNADRAKALGIKPAQLPAAEAFAELAIRDLTPIFPDLATQAGQEKVADRVLQLIKRGLRLEVSRAGMRQLFQDVASIVLTSAQAKDSATKQRSRDRAQALAEQPDTAGATTRRGADISEGEEYHALFKASWESSSPQEARVKADSMLGRH